MPIGRIILPLQERDRRHHSTCAFFLPSQRREQVDPIVIMH